MAIQQINLGSAPSGAGGDTQRAANTKINQNFSNQNHAASRQIGSKDNNVPLANMIDAALSYSVGAEMPETIANLADIEVGSPVYFIPSALASRYPDLPPFTSGEHTQVWTMRGGITGTTKYQIAWGVNKGELALRTGYSRGYGSWLKFYHTENTTKDSNGFLKGKSPVTRLHSDRLEHQGDDKELERIEFEKLGVGDYLLKNTTGLASEGWYIELPQDANKNPLIAVTYSDDGKGNLSIKTYKRKFDFETVSIVADTDNPVDIPETRWIDLRFNDDPSLYDEVADESIE